MLSIQFIRENPELVKTACLNKNLDPKVIDDLLIIDKQRLELLPKVEDLKAEANAHAKKIGHSGGKPTQEQIEVGRKIKEKLKLIEPELKQAQSSFSQLMLEVPNVPASDTPVGADESGNEVIRIKGEKPSLEFNPLPHQELMEKLGMLDTKRAVKIAGFRSYFLLGDGVLLEQA